MKKWIWESIVIYPLSKIIISPKQDPGEKLMLVRERRGIEAVYANESQYSFVLIKSIHAFTCSSLMLPFTLPAQN